MDQQDFQFLVTETVESIQHLLTVKGGEYAGTEDRLSNFKRGATLTGATPLQVAFIYASKHYDGIASFVRDPKRKGSEPIEGRFDDLINYCILMKALIREEAKKKHESLSAPLPYVPSDWYSPKGISSLSGGKR